METVRCVPFFYGEVTSTNGFREDKVVTKIPPEIQGISTFKKIESLIDDLKKDSNPKEY